MKAFTIWEVLDAAAHSAAGGQALHLHNIVVNEDTAPLCFVHALRNGQNIAHLFDRDRERLVKTALYLGVKVVLVERAGLRGQHVDLCGAPLRRALAMCENGHPSMLYFDAREQF